MKPPKAFTGGPTHIYSFIGREVKDRLVGFQPKTRIQNAIEPYLQN